MRLTDYIVAASAIVNAARTGSHEITALGLAHLDELLVNASDDALEIEKALSHPGVQNFVAEIPALHLPADISIILPPEELPPDEPPQIQAEGNVVAFPAHMVKRWPLLTQQPEAHNALMAIAKGGEIGPMHGDMHGDMDGGAA